MNMSTSNAQARAPKKRSYRLGKRAESREETRRRIVHATVDLHGTVGPARTAISQIAERAGVQRHTVYAHFPDEWSLLLACSAHALELDPLPDPQPWSNIPLGLSRIRVGLEELYFWYERNENLTACVLRDSIEHEATRKIVDLRMAPFFRQAEEVLAAGMNERARDLLRVALDFACWRVLRGSSSSKQAAALMAEAVVGVRPEAGSG